MKLLRVTSKPSSYLRDGEFDLAIYASGFEQRASHIFVVHRPAARTEMVFGFEELRDHPIRLANDAVFANVTTVLTDGRDDRHVLDALRAHGDATRVFVDISSMSRTWYAAVLNWARFKSDSRPLELVFGYSVAVPARPFPNRRVKSIEGTAGFEGSPMLPTSLVVLGLGFDRLTPHWVLEQTEPDLAFAYWAEPAATRELVIEAKRANKELLARIDASFSLPLLDVETSFRKLIERVLPHREAMNLTLIPLGPKPHVLANLLVALRLPTTTCLRVTTDRTDILAAVPTGQTAITSVEFA